MKLHDKYKFSKPLKILIAGSHGLVGSALIRFLTTGGHKVIRLQRNPAHTGTTSIYWNPDVQKINPTDLERFDVIIHLGGVNLGSGLWTKKRKKRIRDSRIGSTLLLAKTIRSLKDPPKLFLIASASGFYGDHGDTELTESSHPGNGFLADLTREWELAAAPASDAGIRVVCMRSGLILSPHGGVLRTVTPLFKLGMGTILGSGAQFWPWICIDDVIGAVYHVIHTENIHGPVNFVSPNAVTNRDFTRTLNRILHRPTLLSVPSPLLKIIFRDMADEMFLTSSRVIPEKLLQSGYSFIYPDLEEALRFLLSIN